MSSEKSSQALIPQEQKAVDFYGDELVAVLINGEPLIPVRPICDYLGVSWAGQRERILRDAVLSEAVSTVRVTRTEGSREVSRELACLPLRYLNGWLFGINAGRVKEELRDKVIQYQRDCYEVLSQAFQAPAASSSSSSLMAIREMGLAIASMAEQQMIHEQRLSVTEERLDRAAEVVGQIGKRLRAVEGRLRPASYITDEQAAEISLQVKALAHLLGGHYQTVFSELYRRYGVSSYKLLRVEQYPAVLEFLAEWRETAVSKAEEE